MSKHKLVWKVKLCEFFAYVVALIPLCYCAIMCILVVYNPQAKTAQTVSSNKREIVRASNNYQSLVNWMVSRPTLPEISFDLPPEEPKIEKSVVSENNALSLYQSWDEPLKEYTKNLCNDYDIEHSIVLAIIWNESRFQSDAFSQMGDTYNYGLMQINSATFPFLQEQIGLSCMDELFDPKINILAGVTLLKYHEEYTDNDADMLLRYQVGDGNYSQIKSGNQEEPACLQRVLNVANEFSGSGVE